MTLALVLSLGTSLSMIAVAQERDASAPGPQQAAPAGDAATAASTPGEATAAAPATAPAAAPAAGPVTAPAAGAPAAAAEVPLNPALAERFTSMAAGLLRSQPPSNALWRYATALLQAATRLAPEEPRYARFLIEAATRAGDTDTLIRALENYRKIEPGDEFALTQLIDAYLGRMESSQRKLEYLATVVDAKSIPPTVRSFAAIRMGAIHSERMQEEKAQQSVVRALELNPLNMEALRVRYQWLAAQNAPPADRLTAMLMLLQSNPAQPTINVEVARLLADVGLVQRSLDWFKHAVDVHKQLGLTPPNDVGVDFAAELFIAGDLRGASAVAGQLTTANPDDLNAWLLKLILARAMDDKAIQEQTLRQATVALTNRLASVRRAAGDEGATTRPITFEGEVPLPDPHADLQFLMGKQREDLAQQYVQVAAGVAWLKIYFEEKPAQAIPFVRAVAGAMGEGNELVARLQGWSFLVAGNTDEARVKLAAAAETDPIAAAGLIRLGEKDPAAKAQSDAEARRVLMTYPSRLTGAFLAQALRQRGIKPQPQPVAADLDKVLANFSKDWLKIVTDPKRFYALRLAPAPGRLSAAVGDPVLVEVSVQNVSEFPLTVGPEGVIHQDLWLDANLRGAQPQQFPAEAFGRFTGPMILRPRESMSQVIRLDQGQLARTLEMFPTANFLIGAHVMTNPTTIGGEVRQGPAAQQAALSKLMERRGAPIGQAEVQQKLAAAVQNGTAPEKVRAAETLTKFARLLTGEGASDVARQLGNQAGEAVRVTTGDPDPTVRSWATYLYSVHTQDPSLVKNLLADESWVARTLGVVAIDYIGQSHDLIKPLAENDAEPLVRQLARAALEAQIARPTSQPAVAGAATQPSAPTTQPESPVPAAATTPPGAASPVAPAAPALPESAASPASPASPRSGTPLLPEATPVAPLTPGVPSGATPTPAPEAAPTPTPVSPASPTPADAAPAPSSETPTPAPEGLTPAPATPSQTPAPATPAPEATPTPAPEAAPTPAPEATPAPPPTPAPEAPSAPPASDGVPVVPPPPPAQ